MMKKAFAFVFSYKGRISRKSYLIFHAIAIPLIITLTYPAFRGQFLCIAGVIIIGYCTIPVSVKRYHDLDMGFWAFLGCSWFIPITLQAFTYQSGIPIEILFWNIGKFLWILGTCIYLCSKRGTQGTNKYGEAPI
jgi:uncharacterized membrane protein YhaH (DUF805 family)